MPFGKVADPRTERLYMRVTPAQKSALESSASRSGLSTSEFIRRRALGRPVLAAVDDRAIAELNRIGGLIKLALTRDSAHREHYVLLLGDLARTIRNLAAIGLR